MIFQTRKRHLIRFREIAGVFAKYGWGRLLERVGLGQHVKDGSDFSDEGAPGPIGLRLAIEELGPSFIKLGQILSSRSDIIPEDYIQELSKLQDTVPPVPTEDIITVIKTEFGQEIYELFELFDERPLASASIGQVHKARLKSGEEVIIKVQKPGVEESISLDLEIVRSVARFAEQRWEPARVYGVSDLVDEFSTMLREELDYTREAQNADRLRKNLQDVKDVHIPKVHWELTTRRVLVQELIQGIKISDIDELRKQGLDTQSLAERIAAVFLKQVFEDGFCHSDPHPGNIIVEKDGRIGLLDCGQTALLDVPTKTAVIRLLMSFAEKDSRRFADDIVEAGIAPTGLNMQELVQDISRLMRHYYDLPARATNFGEILKRTMSIAVRHRIRIPASFATLAKILSNLDGITRILDPDFNMTEAARPFISRAVRMELGTDRVRSDLLRVALDLRDLLTSLPAHINGLLRKAIDGSFRVEFKHEGLEDLKNSLTKSGNRLSFALIVSGLLIGSSIIVVSATGPTAIFGYPLLGVIGYVIAAVFGMWLLISILRGGSL